jgi:hypothetical protein
MNPHGKNCNYDGMKPPRYPFMCDGHDSYGYPNDYPHGFNPSQPYCPDNRTPQPNRYPTSGSMLGNAFVLNDYNPYIYDNSIVQYGKVLSLSESVFTRVTQRRDPSCINLSATFDMTDSMESNIINNQFLEQSIINQYESLREVLPVMKSAIKFKIYYTVKEEDGGVVHQSAVTVTSQDMKFHMTDIRDRYVTSCTNLAVVNIPSMKYHGMYTLSIDRIDAYVDVIDTIGHMQNDMNPFYRFVDNNMRIELQHGNINKQPADDSILIATCDVNSTFPFRANVTSRLRISFTAFMSNLIVTPNTFGIWDALTDSKNVIIRDLKNEITELNTKIDELETNLTQTCEDMVELRADVNDALADVADMKKIIEGLEPGSTTDIEELRKNVETNAENIEKMTTDISTIQDSVNTVTETTNTKLDEMSAEVTSVKSDLDELSGTIYNKTQIDNLLTDKVDKVDGMGLSSNDFTDEYKDIIDSFSSTGQVAFSTYLEFPAVGNDGILYIDETEGKSYIWDAENQVYKRIDEELAEGDTIQSFVNE